MRSPRHLHPREGNNHRCSRGTRSGPRQQLRSDGHGVCRGPPAVAVEPIPRCLLAGGYRRPRDPDAHAPAPTPTRGKERMTHRSSSSWCQRSAWPTVLVTMPFMDADLPSIQVGLLKAIGQAHGFRSAPCTPTWTLRRGSGRTTTRPWGSSAAGWWAIGCSPSRRSGMTRPTLTTGCWRTAGRHREPLDQTPQSPGGRRPPGCRGRCAGLLLTQLITRPSLPHYIASREELLWRAAALF